MLGKSGRELFAFIVGIAIAATAVMGCGECDQPVAISQISETVSGTNPCDGEPLLKVEKPIHSNLAKYKDENDAEGIVFPGTYISGSNEKPDQNVFLLINASRPEEWDQIKYRESGGNVFNGYAYLGVDEAKTRMHVRFSVVDRETKSPLILPEFDVTFFNLGYDRSTRNYVKVYNPEVVILSQKTSITKVKNSDNSWTFHSVYKDMFSKTSRPYPDDPVRLYTKEKERAVTTQHFDTDHIEVELWGETVEGKDNYGVGWSMVFGPNLKCAKTIGDDLGDDPVVIDVIDNRNCYWR